MDTLPLIFSGPGATIFVCLTILILAILFLIFRDRFRDLSLGCKDIKLEMPKSTTVRVDTVAEVVESPTRATIQATRDEAEGLLTSPLLALMRAVDNQDRAGIEAAYDKLREEPPFGFDDRELSAYIASELLRAGFHDGLEKLKEIEKTDEQRIAASLYIASYYLGIRLFNEVESHLALAERRANNDKDKVNVFLKRAEITEFIEGKLKAGDYLADTAGAVQDRSEKFRVLSEAGNLY